MLAPLLTVKLLAATSALAAATPHDSADPFRPPDEVPGCHEHLRGAGVRYEESRIAVHTARRGDFLCGAPQVVRYRQGPGAIRWRGSPKVSCPLALSMARAELLIQEEARALFKSRVVNIKHMGTYNCRAMAQYDMVSEHAYANGIDLDEFTLANGTTIKVLDHFRSTGKKGKFLRRLSRRFYDERVFETVITADFDRLHRNHIHVDKARYRVDGAAALLPGDR